MNKSVLILSAMALLLATPAYGQSKKELAAQNAALAQRITTLENRMLTGDPAAERLMQRIDALESAQRTLTGDVERLRFERDNLRAEISALNDDIRRMEELSERTRLHLDAVDMVNQQPRPSFTPQPYGSAQTYGSPHTYGTPSYPTDSYSSTPAPIPGPPSVSNQTIGVQQQYQDLAGLPASGKQKMAEGRFSDARSDFTTYLAAMPDAADAGEVNFWLGESYYVAQDYTNAADAYITSMRKAPNGIKAPDAMVRLAAALNGLGKKAEACQTLDSFPSQYPNAPASVRAKARTEMSRAGC